MKKLVFFILLAALCACQSKPNGSAEELSVSPATIKAGYNLDSYELEVVSNAAWTAEIEGTDGNAVSWLTLTRASGRGNASIKVRVLENKFSDSRTSMIVFKTAGGLKETVSVVQEGNTASDIDSDSAVLKVGTWNIERPTSELNYSLGYWPNRREGAIETIRKANFDIIGTQEASKDMLDDIQSGLTGYEWFGSRRIDYPNRNGILYKTARLKLLENGHFFYSRTPDVDYSTWEEDVAHQQYNCCWGKFQDKRTGTIFYLFNNHFHSSYESKLQPMRDSLRCWDARLLKEKVAQIAGESFALCTGDFNATEEWYSNVTGQKVHDARIGYVELVKGGILIDSRFVAENKINDNEASGVGFLVTGQSETDSKYDHVFLSSLASGGYRVTLYEVITDSYLMTHQGVYTTYDPKQGVAPGEQFQSNPSDHRPVAATILLIP